MMCMNFTMPVQLLHFCGPWLYTAVQVRSELRSAEVGFKKFVQASPAAGCAELSKSVSMETPFRPTHAALPAAVTPPFPF